MGQGIGTFGIWLGAAMIGYKNPNIAFLVAVLALSATMVVWADKIIKVEK